MLTRSAEEKSDILLFDRTVSSSAGTKVPAAWRCGPDDGADDTSGSGSRWTAAEPLTAAHWSQLAACIDRDNVIKKKKNRWISQTEMFVMVNNKKLIRL